MSTDFMRYGFVDYRGNAWPNAHVDTYNRYNEQVFKRAYKETKRGTMAFDEMEFYRDQRHKMFVQIVDINSKGAK
jgi:hypothetical protein